MDILCVCSSVREKSNRAQSVHKLYLKIEIRLLIVTHANIAHRLFQLNVMHIYSCGAVWWWLDAFQVAKLRNNDGYRSLLIYIRQKIIAVWDVTRALYIQLIELHSCYSAQCDVEFNINISSPCVPT